ncbi:MAG: PA domain-containing protein [Flavobacteriia bacterium]|jgi:hypothetical protein
MKKLLLTVTVIGSVMMAHAQIIVAGVSPQNIVGNYNNSWADPASGWGCPDFTLPGVFVEDTLELADDGTPGVNAQGNPASATGCNLLPAGSLAGKIAVVFRGDGATPAIGGCEFGLKAKNCQDAGAVGVIVINRNPNEWISMGAGVDGANVTIPVVMLDITDGTTLVSEMQNGPVVMLMGNKTGLFPNDISLLKRATMAPKAAMVHSALAQNGSEFNFSVGAKVFNPGTDQQSNVSLNATILDPAGNVVYNETATGLNFTNNPFDSVEVVPGTVLPDFSMATYPLGTYTMTYTAILDGGLTDDYAADNTLTYTFSIQDTVFSYTAVDQTTGGLDAANYYRPGTNSNTFSICTVISDPNASRAAVTGVYFSSTTSAASGVTLDGEEMLLSLFQWDDVFTDLNDPNFPASPWSLTEVGFGSYVYLSDLQGEQVFGALSAPVVLQDNQRYLACVQTVNLELYLSYGSTDYTYNTDYTLQPMFPNESDGTWYAVGFGSDLPTALGVGMVDASSIGLTETGVIEGAAYPNPANDLVTVSLNTEGNATLKVTDVSGKVAMNAAVTLVNGKAQVNISGLETGVYVFNVIMEDGRTSQFNVIKK